MKIRMKFIGFGWEASLDAEVEGDKITFDKKEFDQVMGVVAETHDAISGGFQIVETREK